MKIVQIVFFLFFYLNSIGQEIPPTKIFTTENYKAQNQNWGIAQASNDLIYVANNGGLLEYDGEHWQLFSDESNPILRSVNVSEGVVYTGSFMDFGYWIKNTKGELKYSSLVKNYKIKLKEGEEFWSIHMYQKWILFQSKASIYFVNTITKEVKKVESSETITGLFLLDDKIFFQKQNKGLFIIENGQEKLFSDALFFKENRIINCFNQQQEVVFLSEEKGFVSIKEGIVVEQKSTLNKESYSIYSAIQLADNTFVLGTISSGVLFLNENRVIVNKINRKNGLSNNTALSLFQDNFNNVWVGLDNGINYINISSPFKRFEDEDGSLGTVYTSLLYDGILYLGTNQGLFYKKYNSKNKFQLVKRTKGQVWFLKEIDNLLFCGHDKGTFILKNNRIISVITETVGVWDVKSVPNTTSLLIQGNYKGLSILEKQNGLWKFKNKMEGFDISSRFFEFHEDKIYVNHELKGLYELKTDDDFLRIKENKKINIPESGYGSNVFTFGDELFYSSYAGVYKKNGNNFFVKDSLFTKVMGDYNDISTLRSLDTQKNTLYVFSNTNLLFISLNPINLAPQIKKIPLSVSNRNTVLGFENLTQINEDKFLIGTSYGYLIYDESIKNKAENVFISFRSIHVNRIDEAKTSISVLEEALLANEQNNIEFSYSISKFNQIVKNEYQYQLLGLSDNWSNWSQTSTQLFENLPYGNYILNIKGKYGNQITEVESFQFSIKRPFYLSNLIVVIYIIAICLLILAINLYYRRRYKRRNAILLEKVRKDLKLKELENQKEVIRLRNDKLRSDIESKNKELASSTMNIIKKNELLNNLKKELNTIEDRKIGQVIKIIDKNLNNTDDWRLFQEAFNNADKDFLKKIKLKHPLLTPNDLRLCAYLRLNLSSKEIAPLLNISPRSVEVKRYRLRKKMDLEHDSNLSDHILSI